MGALAGGAWAGANYVMRPGEADRYKTLTPEQDAREVSNQIRFCGNQLIVKFPDSVADVIEELVLRVRNLEDRK